MGFFCSVNLLGQGEQVFFKESVDFVFITAL